MNKKQSGMSIGDSLLYYYYYYYINFIFFC